MNLVTKYLTNNDCYKSGRKITVKGIMVHSTATPGAMKEDFYNVWNKPGVKKCVHAFLDDKGIFQTLPWDYRGWHAGASANSTHIGFEICEPRSLDDKEYFNKVYADAVELVVKLCKEYNLTEKNVICHSEGYKLRIASNHADVMHWFPKHGKSMDTFREDVRKGLIDKKVEEVLNNMSIKDLQKFLNAVGILNDVDGKPLKIDGDEGSRTKSAKAKLKEILAYVLK